MIILSFLSTLILAIWITWGGYLMMMPLKRNYENGTLNNWGKIFGYPWLVVFMFLDVIFNIVYGTIIFLDIPRTLVFTKRLDYYLERGKRKENKWWLKLTYLNNWRYKIAYYFCTRFLDPFDPDGHHCQEKE